MIKLGKYPFVTTFKDPQGLQDYADKLCSEEKKMFMLGVMMTTNLISHRQSQDEEEAEDVLSN